MFFMDVLYLHILFIAELITEDWALVRLNSWWTEDRNLCHVPLAKALLRN